MKKMGLFDKMYDWRVHHIPPRQFLLILSFIVGILSGLAAVVLKTTIHYVTRFLTGDFSFDVKLWHFAFPVVGIILTVLFSKYIIKDKLGHGVSRILFSISKKSSLLKFHNNYSSMVASSLTIGTGGSVGSEAPIVLTGASLGSSLGRWLKLNYKQRTLLLGCGAAGAIAGIFQAPIAGVVFTLEVLMLNLTLASIVPLLISSVTGALVAFFLMGNNVLFSFVLKETYVMNDVPFYILLGIFTGMISFYFTRTTMFVENKFSRMKSTVWRVFTGGIVLGFLIFLFPVLYGEGYETISLLLNGQADEIIGKGWAFSFFEEHSYLMVYLGLILIFKVIAMAATTGAGGVGGIFAPSLFTGGFAGYLFAGMINFIPGIQLSQSNFTLAGMAGLMAGVMHAPLMGIFLIAEITGGYGLLIPLIITSTVSYLTIMYFEPHSIYTKRLAKRGELITHNKDEAVLTLMNWRSEIEKDLSMVHPEDTLGDLVKTISRSKRNIFPVIDEDNSLKGVVLLDNIRDVIFNHEMYETTFVRDLMIMPPATISLNDTMGGVFDKFKVTDAWNLPVTREGKYIGFLSKSRIFSAYRKILMEVSD
jgi:CIC family chloride channel protein